LSAPQAGSSLSTHRLDQPGSLTYQIPVVHRFLQVGPLPGKLTLLYGYAVSHRFSLELFRETAHAPNCPVPFPFITLRVAPQYPFGGRPSHFDCANLSYTDRPRLGCSAVLEAVSADFPAPSPPTQTGIWPKHAVKFRCTTPRHILTRLGLR